MILESNGILLKAREISKSINFQDLEEKNYHYPESYNGDDFPHFFGSILGIPIKAENYNNLIPQITSIINLSLHKLTPKYGENLSSIVNSVLGISGDIDGRLSLFEDAEFQLYVGIDQSVKRGLDHLPQDIDNYFIVSFEPSLEDGSREELRWRRTNSELSDCSIVLGSRWMDVNVLGVRFRIMHDRLVNAADEILIEHETRRGSFRQFRDISNYFENTSSGSIFIQTKDLVRSTRSEDLPETTVEEFFNEVIWYEYID